MNPLSSLGGRCNASGGKVGGRKGPVQGARGMGKVFSLPPAGAPSMKMLCVRAPHDFAQSAPSLASIKVRFSGLL